MQFPCLAPGDRTMEEFSNADIARWPLDVHRLLLGVPGDRRGWEVLRGANGDASSVAVTPILSIYDSGCLLLTRGSGGPSRVRRVNMMCLRQEGGRILLPTRCYCVKKVINVCKTGMNVSSNRGLYVLAF